MSGDSPEALGLGLSGRVNGVPERFVPAEMQGELVEAEHIARYRWACGLAGGRRVLDAGCGVGYGSVLLKRAGAAMLVAVDLSQAVIDVARQTAGEEIVWRADDLRSLSFAADSFDLVVCFEVIEHVDEQDRVLDELARVLSPEGVLLISSPNRAHYVPGNPHHRHEYSPDELRAALEDRFPAVGLVPQHAMLTSAIGLSTKGPIDGAQVEQLVDASTVDEIYTVAMAGRELPHPPDPTIALTHFVEIREWLEHYRQQEQILEQQTAALREVDLLRHERGEALRLLADREQALAATPELNERLATATAALGPLQEAVQRLESERDALANASRIVRAMESSLSWRLTRPLRDVKRLVRALRA